MAKDKKENQDFFTHFPSDISKTIENYVRDKVLVSSRYLFTRREGKRQYAFCTHCKREHESKGLKHGSSDRCPLCKSLVWVKASGRGRKTLVDEGYLLWYEKSRVNPKAIIARGFYLLRDYTKDFRNTETFINPIAMYLFEWGAGGKMAYRNYWGKRSAWHLPKTIHSEAIHSMRNKACYWARHSIVQAVKGTPFQYCTWEHYEHQDHVKVFDFASRYPCMEYLTKLGMGPAVSAKLHGQATFGAINWNGKTIDKVLRLTKAEAKEWVKQPFKSGLLSLYAYQKFKRMGLPFSFEQAHQVCRLAEKEKLKVLQSETQRAPLLTIIKYLLKQISRKGSRKWYHDSSSVLGDWKDYLAECQELGMDLTQESVLFPNDLHDAHQKTSSKIKFKRDESLNARIVNRAKELDEKFRFVHHGLIIRPAASNKELFDEGQALNHCVGGYAQRYADGSTDIFLIRNADKPDKPFYTMEVSKGKVVQCRGLKNCDMTPEVKVFVELFIGKKLLTKQTTRIDVTNLQPA